MTTLNDILSAFRDAARSNREMGDKFERLLAAYLLADPQFSDRLADVWLWSEWPDRSGMDVGIDLVARERGTGDYWAIQCKFYDPDHTLQKADIDSFFTASGKRFATSAGERSFSHRLIVSTTDKWSSNAEKALGQARACCNSMDIARNNVMTGLLVSRVNVHDLFHFLAILGFNVHTKLEF